MKRLIIPVAIVLALVITSCKSGAPTPPVTTGVPGTANNLQLVQTAYMVIHPGANKGDTITFPLLPASGSATTYVHFPLQSPCAANVYSGIPGNPPHCTVTATVHATGLAQYPYYIDSNPAINADPQGKCRSCCFMCQVVVPNPNPGQPQLFTGNQGSGPYPTVEVLIDESENGQLTAQNTAAYPGQSVKWFESGVDNTGWTITFADPGACTANKPIGGGELQSPTCIVAGSVASSPYKYTMTDGVKTGTGLLYVSQPIPGSASK